MIGRAALLVAAALSLAPFANAQPADPVTAARKAVVIVVAKGIDTSQGNTEVSTRGSGFFINSEGNLVTAYHLKTKLGSGVDEGSIQYEVYLGTNANPIPAQFLAANGPADIMILYAPVDGQPIDVLKPVYKPSPALVVNNTSLTALGYPDGFGYTPQSGQLTSWQGPVMPPQVGWTTNANFNGGMSGGPVIVADGRVAAVVKGVDQGIGLVVPVSYVPPEYWERDRVKPSAETNNGDAGRVVVSRPTAPNAQREISMPVAVAVSPCDTTATQRIAAAPSVGWSVVDGSVRFALRKFRGDSIETDVVGPAAGWALEVKLKPGGTCGPNGTVVGETAEMEGLLTYREVSLVENASSEVIAEGSAGAEGGRIPIGTFNEALTFRLEKPDGTSQLLKPKPGDFRMQNGILTLDTGRALQRGVE